ncbi:MAG: hypothetical protein AAF703_02835 [Cyanobacteria bacterium P01_D01_bin.105]
MRQSPHIAQVLAGMAVLVMVHIVLGFLTYLLALGISSLSSSSPLLVVLLFGVLGIGISQLLYVIPLCIWLSRKRQIGMRNGAVIGAVLTALLNGSCFIYFWSVW